MWSHRLAETQMVTVLPTRLCGAQTRPLEPDTAEPGTPSPGTPQSRPLEPDTAEPGTLGPETPQTRPLEADTAEPGTPGPGTPHSGTPDTEETGPGDTKTDDAQPEERGASPEPGPVSLADLPVTPSASPKNTPSTGTGTPESRRPTRLTTPRSKTPSPEPDPEKPIYSYGIGGGGVKTDDVEVVPADPAYKGWDFWAAAMKHKSFADYQTPDKDTLYGIGPFVFNIRAQNKLTDDAFFPDNHYFYRYLPLYEGDDSAETATDIDNVGRLPPAWEKPTLYDAVLMSRLAKAPVIVRIYDGSAWDIIIADENETSIKRICKQNVAYHTVVQNENPYINRPEVVSVTYFTETRGAQLNSTATETTDEEEEMPPEELPEPLSEVPRVRPASTRQQGTRKGRLILSELARYKAAYLFAVTLERSVAKRDPTYVSFQDKARNNFWKYMTALPEHLSSPTFQGCFVAKSWELNKDTPTKEQTPAQIRDDELGFVPCALWVRANHSNKPTMYNEGTRSKDRYPPIRYSPDAFPGSVFNKGSGYRPVELTLNYNDGGQPTGKDYDFSRSAPDAGMGLYFYGKVTNSERVAPTTMVYYPPARIVSEDTYERNATSLTSNRKEQIEKFMAYLTAKRHTQDTPRQERKRAKETLKKAIEDRLKHDDFVMKVTTIDDKPETDIYYPLGDNNVAKVFYNLMSNAPNKQESVKLFSDMMVAKAPITPTGSGTFLEKIVLLEDHIMQNFDLYNVYTIVPPGFKTINPETERCVSRNYQSPTFMKTWRKKCYDFDAQTMPKDYNYSIDDDPDTSLTVADEDSEPPSPTVSPMPSPRDSESHRTDIRFHV